MTTFDSREKAMENLFVKDKELEFKAVARRRKLLGLWAAEKMRMSEKAAAAYGMEIVRYGVEDTREGAVVNKILADLKSRGVLVTEADVRSEMERLHEVAIREVATEVK